MFSSLILLAFFEDGFFFFFFLSLNQIGVINAVRNSLNSSEEITALWVTHRLEELEYADGAVYMENGKVVMQGDAANILDFIRSRQSAYIKQINY
jgi:ABC-type glutathione transport system ATPase component